MYRFFDKHGKKLLAVVSVFLMIGWSLSSTNLGRNSREDAVYGKFDGGNLSVSALQGYKAEWQLLRDNAFANDQFMNSGLIYLDVNARQQVTIRQALARDINIWERSHPAIYALLVKEAEKLGAQASNDQVRQAMATLGQDDTQTGLATALAHFLSVQNAMELALNVVKVSGAEAKQAMALRSQLVSVNVVKIPYGQYASIAKPPTTQQMDAQFQTYRTSTGADNPMGFGYLYPDRVKLQFVELSRAAIAKTVKIDSEAQWVYYYRNPGEFPSTGPADSSSLSLGPDSETPASKPLPFDQVKDKIIAKLTDKAVDEIESDLASRLSTTMAQDYGSYRASAPDGADTAPSTAPSSVDVSYDDPEYLTKLVASVGARESALPTARKGYSVIAGVEPIAVIERTWMSQDDLAKLPGIGESSFDNGGGAPVDFVTYAMHGNTVLVDPQWKKQFTDAGMPLLGLYQPSALFKSASGDGFIFRLSAVQASHAPTELKEVSAKVEADLMSQSMHDAATADAAALLALAEKSKDLAAAAKPADQTVVEVGPMQNNIDTLTPGLNLKSDSARASFIRQVFAMLQMPNSATGCLADRRMAVIDLPGEGEALVVEMPLSKVHSKFDDPVGQVAAIRAMQSLDVRFGLAQDWLSWQSIYKRANFQPAAPEKPEQEEPAPLTPGL